MHDVQIIERVSERDIDLLLLEELHVSPTFRSWLLNQVFGLDSRYTRFSSARHSVVHSALGESDLILLAADDQGNKAAVLIENKIDALPQVEQGVRYRLRGQSGLEDGSWADFRTCIVAPESYLAGTNDTSNYQARVSYETIRDWFRDAGAHDGRSAYKARFIQEAIEQNRRRYQPIPNPAVTLFWFEYWRIVRTEFQQLQMNKPGHIPAKSSWPQFRNSELGPGRRIVHKLADGVVDLEIRAAGGRVEEVVARNGGVLNGEVEVVRTGKSASVRLRVPTVDRFAEFSSQAAAVRAGLSAACKLLTLSGQIMV